MLIIGSAGPDNLFGSNQADTIIGLDGNDTIEGQEGNDIIDDVGTGDDIFRGKAGRDILDGDEGNDTLEGGFGNDTLDGGSGDDSLLGDDGNDVLNAGKGIDTLNGGAGDDSLRGEGNDILSGEEGVDTLIVFDSSNNILDGGADDDYLSGTFSYGFTGNVFRGGDGSDTYNINLGFRTDTSKFGMEIQDTAGRDSLILKNSSGSDPVLFLSGLESGKIGVVRQETNLGVDLNEDGRVRAGDDLIILDFFNAAGNAPGNGFIETVGEISGDEIIANVPTEEDTRPGGINVIEGTAGPDTLNDTNANDSILGFDGNDLINIFSTGNDVLRGDRGQDTLIDSGVGGGNDLLDGGPDNDSLLGGSGDDSLLGSDGNDTLVAGSGADTLSGGNGNDLLAGNSSDRLEGNSGNDSLFVDGSNTTLVGGVGNDLLSGSFVYSFTGNLFRGGAGADVYRIQRGLNLGFTQFGIEIEDTAGNDSLILKNFSDRDIDLFLRGLESGKTGMARQGQNLAIDLNEDGKFKSEDDLTILDFFNTAGNGPGAGFIETVGIFSGNEIISNVPAIDDEDTVPGVNIVRGTGNADTLEGSNGNDSILGLGGNDRINSGDGNDTLKGGSGGDTIADIGEGNDFLNGGSGNDNLSSAGGDDRLLGSGGNDTLFGGSGANVLNGGKGNDSLLGGDRDKLIGNKGRDTLSVSGSNNTLQGGGGNDFLLLNSGNGFTGNLFQGGSGRDVYSINLAFGSQFGLEIKDSGGNDTLILNDPFGLDPVLSFDGLAAGTTGAIRENGNLAVDLNQDGTIKPEDDLAIADFFNDAGNAGKGFIETIGGLSGNEILQALGSSGTPTLSGTQRNDKLEGTSQSERLEGKGGNDRLLAAGGDDTLIGNSGKDILKGEDGKDSLMGGSGNDNLVGGDGNDRLFGGGGRDRLNGGAGRDVLTGNNGSDRFIFQTNRTFQTTDLGVDNIVDFKSSEDQILLDRTTFRGLNIISGNRLSADDFAVVNSNDAAALSDASIVYNQANGGLFYNSDGNDAGFGIGDRFATLIGEPNLQSANFILTK